MPLGEGPGQAGKRICLLSTWSQSAVSGLELAFPRTWNRASCGHQDRFREVGGPVIPAAPTIGSKPGSK